MNTETKGTDGLAASTPPSVSRTWLWTARGAALLAGASYGALLFGIAPQIDFFTIILLLVFPLSYLHVLVNLFLIPARTTFAMAATIGAGSTLLWLTPIIMVLFFEGLTTPEEWWLLGIWVVILLPHIVVLGSAWKMHRELPDENGGKARTIKGILQGGVYVAATVLIIFLDSLTLHHPPLAMNEASGVGSVRLLDSCARSYQAAYPEKGYPTNLAELGPGGTDCLDERLASGEKLGYQFHYTPGQPDQDGVVTTFTINAAPIECGKTGVRTYFADDSGDIRYTNDEYNNCPAADANSPPILL
jgi:hypothetical protein